MTRYCGGLLPKYSEQGLERESVPNRRGGPCGRLFRKRLETVDAARAVIAAGCGVCRPVQSVAIFA
jgi:hypothetical protein